jgi:hypothetical protein
MAEARNTSRAAFMRRVIQWGSAQASPKPRKDTATGADGNARRNDLHGCQSPSNRFFPPVTSFQVDLGLFSNLDCLISAKIAC